jgi:hypothetical protein
MNHFKKLLDEICLNHAYPIKHKLGDCDMMKNFMALRSLAPDEGDMTPFPGENTVMMIYYGRPSPSMHHVSNPSLGTPARCSWGRRNARM